MSIFCVDIDGTLTTGPGYTDYSDAEVLAQQPNQQMIDIINRLYDKGHTIILHTARIWANFEVTVKWLAQHNVKYTTLIMGKPLAHFYIDDKNMTIAEFMKINTDCDNNHFDMPKLLAEQTL